jgi:hypothetical protein
MTMDEARSIQFLRTRVGLTYRRLAEWWCHSKAANLPQKVQEFGQVLCGEAEYMLELEMGAFDGMMRDGDTFGE